MATRGTGAVLRQVEAIYRGGAVAGMTDAQLLERFASRADEATAEAAFAAIVARHGPMVLGVCRKLVRDPIDAEDAFQATFLVLARRAGAVRVDDSAGRWLYGVARRVANRARRRSAGRCEARGAMVPEVASAGPGPLDEAILGERAALLRDEVDRLPGRYREAVVLCHLEGRSLDEAAARLGRPVGTIKVRLSRARALLRDRLARRGLAPGVLPVAVPATLIHRTVRAAVRDAFRAGGGLAGGAAVSGTVLNLAEGVIAMTGWAKVQGAGVALLSLGVTVAAVAGLTEGQRDGTDGVPSVGGRSGVVAAFGDDGRDGSGVVVAEAAEDPTADRPGSLGAEAERIALRSREVDDEVRSILQTKAWAEKQLIHVQRELVRFSSMKTSLEREAEMLADRIIGKDLEREAGPEREQGPEINPRASRDGNHSIPPSGDPFWPPTTPRPEPPGDGPPPSIGPSPGSGASRETPPSDPSSLMTTANELLFRADTNRREAIAVIRGRITDIDDQFERLRTERDRAWEALARALGAPEGAERSEVWVASRRAIEGGDEERTPEEPTPPNGIDPRGGLPARPTGDPSRPLGLQPEPPEAGPVLPVESPRRPGASPVAAPPEGGSPAEPRPREFEKTTLPEYVVEPPDMIRVEVLEALPGRPITGERLVRPDGKVSLDFYGELSVAGLTPMEIKEGVILHLRQFLSDEALGLIEVNPRTSEQVSVRPRDSNRVFVEVTSYNSKVYYVLGDVVQPGRLVVTGGETVLDAITYASGLLPTADPKNIRLVRPPGQGVGTEAEVLPVDWEAIVMQGDPATNYQIKPGDRIIVYRKADAPDAIASDVERRIEQEFLADETVRELREHLRDVEARLREVQRLIRNPADPSLSRLRDQRQRLLERYEQLWADLEPALRARLSEDVPEANRSDRPTGPPPPVEGQPDDSGALVPLLVPLPEPVGSGTSWEKDPRSLIPSRDPGGTLPVPPDGDPLRPLSLQPEPPEPPAMDLPEPEIGARPPAEPSGRDDQGPSATGAGFRPVGQESKLVIDVVKPDGDVLRGSEIDYKATVRNVGNGPTGKVNLVATLSGGLQGYDHEGNLSDARRFEQFIGPIGPGGVFGPVILSVRAVGVGEQDCVIEVIGPAADPKTPPGTGTVNVVAPELKVDVEGPASRPVGSVADYVVTITNNGTAPATEVLVGFFAPESGEPEVPNDAEYFQDPKKTHHRIYWRLPRLDKGESRQFNVPIRLDRIALYPVQVAAQCQGFTDAKDIDRDSVNTEFVGIPEVAIVAVSRKDPVIDEGGSTEFEIRIRNIGSKDATNVVVDFFTNEWIKVDSTDLPGALTDPMDPHHHAFAPIDRLAPGADRTFVVTVEATKPGPAVANFDVKVFWDGQPEAAAVRSTNYVRIAEGGVDGEPGRPDGGRDEQKAGDKGEPETLPFN